MSQSDAASVTSEPATTLSFKEKLCYGLGDVSNGLAVSSVSVWFLYYLTDVAGLGAFLAGVAVTVGRLWDAVTDPIMGWITDHTKSRWGKRLPYLLFGAIPYAISYAALWVVPEFENERSTFIYITLALLVFNTCLTVVFVPYTSLTAAITNSYDERTSLTGFRMVSSQVAFLLGASLPPLIVTWSTSETMLAVNDFFGSWAGTARQGHAIQAILFGFIMVASVWTTFFGTTERDIEEPKEEKETTTSPLSYASSILEELWGNRPFFLSVLILLLANTAATLAAVNLPYYLEYVLLMPDQRASILFTLFLSAILSVPMWVKAAKRFGKAETFRVAMLCYVALFCVMPFLGGDTGSFIYVLSVFIGFFHAAAITLPWAIVPDVVEFDELKSGQRREGLFYGGTTFSYKAATGIAFLLSTAVLELSGYVANQAQTPLADSAIRFLIGPLPALVLILASYLALRYPLTKQRHLKILDELAQRKAKKI